VLQCVIALLLAVAVVRVRTDLLLELGALTGTHVSAASQTDRERER
jgi:hypothetical protein